MLSVGMRYKGKAVGVIRVYTEQEQTFSQLQIGLLKAVASQAAAAIENARLANEQLQAAALEQQVRMAADVQRRMIPAKRLNCRASTSRRFTCHAMSLAGTYTILSRCLKTTLAWSSPTSAARVFPASLIMASVRASLRAQVDNVYYLYEIVRRLNMTLWRDTEDAEFVTLFYGVVNAATRRFTYCNAGHPPGLLLRDGKLTDLTTDNMVLGVSPDEQYTQGLLELRSGDLILLYTDGLADAINFNGEYSADSGSKMLSSRVEPPPMWWHRIFSGRCASLLE